MKYIDAEKLVAALEKRLNENCSLGEKAECFNHRAVEDNDILAIIESLQQEMELPEKYQTPDWLEEYIENEINHYGLSLYKASYGTFSASQIDRIIRNAFELGLNARKEE